MIFRRNTEVLARFTAHFAEQESGNFVYRPPGAKTGMVIPFKDYASLLERLEQQQKLNLALTWLAIGGGAFWGVRAYLRTGSLLEFALPFAIGCAVAFLLSLRTYLELLRPLERDRRKLESDSGVRHTRH